MQRPMNAFRSIATRLMAVAAIGALSACAVPTAETLSPFQEPWPWTKVVLVNRTNHDVLAVQAGQCETGPAPRQSQSMPAYCFLGKKPEAPIAITWSDSVTCAPHTTAVALPPLWREKPGPDDLTTGYLCVLLREDERPSMTIVATPEACAVL